MTIWLDNHLSPALARWIESEFGETCSQVRDLGLARAPDPEIFSRARDAARILVTKDRDFAELVTRLGPPPAIVLLAVGNTSTHLFDNEKLGAVGNFRPGAQPDRHHGNVSEWVEDCYVTPPVPARYLDFGPNPAACRFRIRRGGSYLSEAVTLRSANRSEMEATKGQDITGLRVARDIRAQTAEAQRPRAAPSAAVTPAAPAQGSPDSIAATPPQQPNPAAPAGNRPDWSEAARSLSCSPAAPETPAAQTAGCPARS